VRDVQTPAAADAELRTLKAQIRRQQKHLKQPSSAHLLPVAPLLPGSLYHCKHRNYAMYFFCIFFLLLITLSHTRCKSGVFIRSFAAMVIDNHHVDVIEEKSCMLHL